MTFTRWLPTFLAFPIGGLLAFETVGSVTNAGTAAAAGLIAGAVIGAGQWRALRDHGVDGRWPFVTAAAMAAGSALAAVATHAGTDVPDLILTGAVTGAAVGIAQAGLLGPKQGGTGTPPRRGPGLLLSPG